MAGTRREGHRDLILIGRYDQTGGATYRIDANGHKVPEFLVARGGEEAWNEVAVRVPAELLVDGTNQFAMTRVSPGPSDVEWYYLWFAQPADPETAFTCRGETTPAG